MEIFVINLDRNPERLAHISQQLESLGMSFERIPAVDGKTLPNFRERFNAKKFFLECGHELVPGEAGCSLSHIKIWETVVRKKIDFALVLEDDVVINKELKSFLSEEKNYSNIDYLKLDNRFEDLREILSKDGKSFNQKKIINLFEVEKYKIVECDPIPYLAGGYMISKFGAKTFLASTKKMYYPIDILPRYTFPYTKQAVLIPNLITHPEIRNTSISGRVFEETPILRSFFNRVGRVFSRRALRILSIKLEKIKIKKNK